jgi:hypothetical protein
MGLRPPDEDEEEQLIQDVKDKEKEEKEYEKTWHEENDDSNTYGYGHDGYGDDGYGDDGYGDDGYGATETSDYNTESGASVEPVLTRRLAANQDWNSWTHTVGQWFQGPLGPVGPVALEQGTGRVTGRVTGRGLAGSATEPATGGAAVVDPVEPGSGSGQTKPKQPDEEEEKGETGATGGSGEGSGAGSGAGSGSGHYDKKGNALRPDGKKFNVVPNYNDAPPSYALSENDIRAAYPYSIDSDTGAPRKSDQLYYVDLNIGNFTQYFVTPIKTWNYQTKNFGTFISSETSQPYHPSWRIRRSASQWPMVDSLPRDQKIRLIGTYHDLVLGPYWDGYAEEHEGKGPVWNVMQHRAKPIVFAEG